MDELEKLIKEDINFLEYPNWVLDRKSKATRWLVEKGHGKYEIACAWGLPTYFDKLVLYYLLYKLYKESEFKILELVTTRYEIAKQIFPENKNLGKQQFDRIMSSLKKWKAVSIHFEGVFYEGDGHTIRGFSVLDEYVLRKETKVLKLRFNEAYIKQLQETKFYKLIDFEQYRKLSRSISARLYEILIKNFKDRDIWIISIKNLAEKLTLEKRSNAKNYYPSDVIAQLNPGINEINKKTNLTLLFTYDKNQEVCTFKKVATFKPAKKDLLEKEKNPDSIKEKAQEEHNQKLTKCLSYFDSLNEDEKNRILNDIQRDPFMRFIPEKSAQILAYLTVNKFRDFADV